MVILAPKGSRAIVVPQQIDEAGNRAEHEVIFDRGTSLGYIGDDDKGYKYFHLSQDEQPTEMKLSRGSVLKSEPPQSDKLLKQLESQSGGAKPESDWRRATTEVTGSEDAGYSGFLLPNGRAFHIDNAHETIANDAGTTLTDVLDEGTMRVSTRRARTLWSNCAPGCRQWRRIPRWGLAGLMCWTPPGASMAVTTAPASAATTDCFFG